MKTRFVVRRGSDWSAREKRIGVGAKSESVPVPVRSGCQFISLTEGLRLCKTRPDLSSLDASANEVEVLMLFVSLLFCAGHLRGSLRVTCAVRGVDEGDSTRLFVVVASAPLSLVLDPGFLVCTAKSSDVLASILQDSRNSSRPICRSAQGHERQGRTSSLCL